MSAIVIDLAEVRAYRNRVARSPAATTRTAVVDVDGPDRVVLRIYERDRNGRKVAPVHEEPVDAATAAKLGRAFLAASRIATPPSVRKSEEDDRG